MIWLWLATHFTCFVVGLGMGAGLAMFALYIPPSPEQEMRL